MSQVRFGQRLGDNRDFERVRDGNTGRMIWTGLALRSATGSVPLVSPATPVEPKTPAAAIDRNKVESEQLAELFN